MIASDSNRIVPSPSIKAGSAIIGLTARYAASRCVPFMTAAIQRGAPGTYVYIINADDTVSVRRGARGRAHAEIL
jgi:hypothetical protein